jgi:hypothetical protein
MQIKKHSKTSLHTCQNSSNKKYWDHQMLMRIWSNQITHRLVLGMENGTSHSGKQFVAFFKKVKHVSTI